MLRKLVLVVLGIFASQSVYAYCNVALEYITFENAYRGDQEIVVVVGTSDGFNPENGTIPYRAYSTLSGDIITSTVEINGKTANISLNNFEGCKLIVLLNNSAMPECPSTDAPLCLNSKAEYPVKLQINPTSPFFE